MTLSCLQAECPPEQQGALHTGTFGFSGDLIEALEFFRLNSPNLLRVGVLIYIDKGLGDMSKFTQQEAVPFLIPVGFPLGCRGIRKQEYLGWEAGSPADCSAGRFQKHPAWPLKLAHHTKI